MAPTRSPPIRTPVADATDTLPNTTAAFHDSTVGTPGIVGYWQLGERSGTTAADTMGLNPGTYTGVFTLGQPGALANDPSNNKSVFFNNGCVSVPNSTSLSPTSQITISAWVNPDLITMGGT